jgi:uncharacterized membrane protein YphA (DoxX/SURF4 family)
MDWVVFVVRVGLGLMFGIAGGLKIGHFDEFAGQIAGFEILPQALIAPLALLLPFVEVALGVYLTIGLFTRVAAGFAAVQLLIFAIAIASAVVRGISASCGCFGPQDQTVTSWPEVARDVALMLLAAFVAWRAPGALATDRRMEQRYE